MGTQLTVSGAFIRDSIRSAAPIVTSMASSTSTASSVPSTTAAPPITPGPEPEPEPEPSCLDLKERMEDCVLQGKVFECKSCATANAGEPCCSCQGGEVSSTTSAIAPSTVTETTTTSPGPSGQCKAWCAKNNKSWGKKCKWTGCSGCSSCYTRSSTTTAIAPSTVTET